MEIRIASLNGNEFFETVGAALGQLWCGQTILTVQTLEDGQDYLCSFVRGGVIDLKILPGLLEKMEGLGLAQSTEELLTLIGRVALPSELDPEITFIPNCHLDTFPIPQGYFHWQETGQDARMIGTQSQGLSTMLELFNRDKVEVLDAISALKEMAGEGLPVDYQAFLRAFFRLAVQRQHNLMDETRKSLLKDPNGEGLSEAMIRLAMTT